MKENEELTKVFHNLGELFFQSYPQIEHEWSLDSSDFQLTIKKKNDSGFDLHVELFGDEIILYCESMHQHVTNYENKPIPEFANEFLGLVYDYLTTDVRLKELQSNGKPYKWIIESLSGDTWEHEQSTGFLIYNYFGRKTTKIFQNDCLPPRMNQANIS